MQSQTKKKKLKARVRIQSDLSKLEKLGEINKRLNGNSKAVNHRRKKEIIQI